MALTFVTDEEPGIRRVGRKHFRYVRDGSGRDVRDERELARIRALAIPPAWTDVWICARADGHIQATGRDAKGRKQYRYHAQFRSRRDKRKFDQLVPFGQALPQLREKVDADLRSPALSRDRVVAAVVSLLERTYVRVGNEAYARENRSFGLTTLRCAHAELNGTALRLRFTGKGGKRFDVTCCEPRLARVVRRCRELPGQPLFQYLDDSGDACPVSSTDVNDYLRVATSFDATAKTFRTWGATLMAAQQLAQAEPPESSRAASVAINQALLPVAEQLGNTVTVCRASYVHPAVLAEFERGALAQRWASGPARAAGGLDRDERRLLTLLERA